MSNRVSSPLLAAATEIALRELTERSPEISELALAFMAEEAPLALVGGPVRDALLGRLTSDLDFTTAATPDRIKVLLRDWAEDVWETGIEFGTVSAQRGDIKVEITTYRSESYQPDSRKPAVRFGNSLVGDLQRRDFTINAMAIELTDGLSVTGARFVDPFNGVAAVNQQIIDTPGSPEDSFSDDPLRMMRAVRFAAQLGFSPSERVLVAIRDMRERLNIISQERIRDELIKIIMSDRPRLGMGLLVSTGIADIVIPEIPKLMLEIDEHFRHKDVYEHSLTVLDQAISMEERLGGPNLIIRDRKSTRLNSSHRT